MPFPPSNEANSILVVPRFLYGPKMSQAHRRWKAVARKAAKSGSWEVALAGVEFMPLEEVKGDFACNNSHALLFTGENLWLNDTFEALFHATADRACSSEDPDAWAKFLEGLTGSGLDHFWFALSVCVTGVGIIKWRDIRERRRTARVFLSKLLRWWPQLCVYDQRFSMGQKMGIRGWPGWAAGLAILCEDLGVKSSDIDKFSDDPVEAAKLAADWLEKPPMPK